MSPTTRRVRDAATGNATPISNAVIVLAIVVTSAWLVWTDKVSGDAYIGLVGMVVGALVNARGVSAGSKASTDPPPAD